MPDPTARALVVTTGLDLVRKGEIGGSEVLVASSGRSASEKSATLVEPFLVVARDLAELWCAPDQVEARGPGSPTRRSR